jgi:hypothetical protein
MHHIHHLLRHRTHHRHERWGVFAALAIVTLVIWATSSAWITKAPASSSTIFVQNISAPDVVNVTRQTDKKLDLAALALVDKRTNKPAAGVWVGLRIADESLRSPHFTYFGWYSPHAERAFYPTDDMGVVYFPLQSEIPGHVTYEVYVGNPDRPASQKYKALGSEFSVEYR